MWPRHNPTFTQGRGRTWTLTSRHVRKIRRGPTAATTGPSAPNQSHPVQREGVRHHPEYRILWGLGASSPGHHYVQIVASVTARDCAGTGVHPRYGGDCRSVFPQSLRAGRARRSFDRPAGVYLATESPTSASSVARAAGATGPKTMSGTVVTGSRERPAPGPEATQLVTQ